MSDDLKRPAISDNDSNHNQTDDSSDEVLRKLLKPSVTSQEAVALIRKSYAQPDEPVEVLKQLDSYDDANFLVKISSIPLLLKIHNGVESRDFLEVYEKADNDFYKAGHMNSVVHLQTFMMEVLTEEGIRTSYCKKSKDSEQPVSIHSLSVVSPEHSPQRLVVRLMRWIDGRLMSEVPILPLETLADAGRFLGKIDKILDRFNEAQIQAKEMSLNDALPANVRQSWSFASFSALDALETNKTHIDASLLVAARRYHQWDGKNTADLREFVHCIKDEKRRKLVLSILDTFKTEILDSGAADQFRRGLNHSDYNDANVILDDELFVKAVIDFGDSVESWRVLDVSVAMAYGMLSTLGKANRGISAAAAVLRGYNSVYPLTGLEREHLVLLVACRLACSVTLGAYSYEQNPLNHYLLFHAEPAWRTLEMLWGHDTEQRRKTIAAFNRILDQACFYSSSREKVITCYDLDCPDPTVVDFLSSVRLPSSDLEERPKKKRRLSAHGRHIVTFATGNRKKLEEVQRILKLDGEDPDRLPFDLTNMKLDLPELQGDPMMIAAEKCKAAAAAADGAVITEDTSLCFNALHSLPGPYIKWFLESCGHDGLNKMLDGFDDRTAFAQTVVAFCPGPGKEVALFQGCTNGRIVSPRGALDFGWDPIFEPDEGAGKTYAEMSKDEKDSISHRSRAFARLREYMQSNVSSIKQAMES